MSFVETKKKLDSEKNPVEQYNILKTMNNGLRIVKLHDVQLGIASNDEEEKAMIEMLSHYGSLSDHNSVLGALCEMHKSTEIATDLRDSGLKPETEIVENGRHKFIIEGKLYNEFGCEIGETAE